MQEQEQIPTESISGSEDKAALAEASDKRPDDKPRRKSKGCSVVELFDPETKVSTVQVYPPKKKKKAVVQVYDPATDITTTQVFPAKRVRRANNFVHTFTIDNKQSNPAKKRKVSTSGAGGSGIAEDVLCTSELRQDKEPIGDLSRDNT